MLRLAAATLLFWYVQAAPAAVSVHTLGFDTLAASSATVSTGYGAFDDGVNHFAGFDWSHGPLAVADRNDFALNPFAVGFQHGVASPDNVAFNFGGVASVSVDALSGSFAFVGARFTAWFDLAAFGMPSGVQTLSLEGWKGGSLLFQDSLTLSPFAQSLVTENWIGIDRLTLKTEVTFNGETRRPLQWMMDDFQYSVVPEPGALPQLAVGLLMLFAFSLGRRSIR
jgi:hypothetical protein